MIADWFCNECGGFHFCDKHYCRHFYALEAQARFSTMYPMHPAHAMYPRTHTRPVIALPNIWAKPKSGKSYAIAVFGGLVAAIVTALIWFGIQQRGQRTHPGGLIVVALLIGFLSYCVLARGKD
jgi:hypothetical protein